MMGKKRQRDIATAQAEAEVRYGPQIRSLRAMLQELKANLRTDVDRAHYNAEATKQAVRAARPELERAYGAATTAAQSAGTMLSADLAKLSAAADPFKAASSREATGAARRLAEATAASLQSLTDRETAASTGAQFQIGKLQGDYAQQAAKIRNQMLGVQSDVGAYVGGRTGTLQKDRASRTVTKRGQDLTSDDKYLTKYGMTRDEFLALPPAKRQALADPAKPKAKKPKDWQPPASQGKAQDTVKAAILHAKELAEDGASREEIRNMLLKGEPAQTVETVVNGKTKKVRVPKIPQYPELLASTALEVVFDGHLSRETVNRLHERGIKVKPLQPFRPRSRINSPGRPSAGRT